MDDPNPSLDPNQARRPTWRGPLGEVLAEAVGGVRQRGRHPQEERLLGEARLGHELHRSGQGYGYGYGQGQGQGEGEGEAEAEAEGEKKAVARTTKPPRRGPGAMAMAPLCTG